MEARITVRGIEVALARALPPWAPILITGGSPAQWITLARRLHPEGFTVLDCRRTGPNDFGSALYEGGDALLLVEVQTIGAPQQAQLFEFLGLRAIDGAPRARVIAGASARLLDVVSAGRFREDLLYRLNVIHLTLP